MTVAESSRRAADEGRWWNDCCSAPRSPCNQWLPNDTDPSPNHFMHESFSGLLCNTIVLFCTTENNTPYLQRPVKTKRWHYIVTYHIWFVTFVPRNVSTIWHMWKMHKLTNVLLQSKLFTYEQWRMWRSLCNVCVNGLVSHYHGNRQHQWG